jgi:hypothetical protein
MSLVGQNSSIFQILEILHIYILFNYSGLFGIFIKVPSFQGAIDVFLLLLLVFFKNFIGELFILDVQFIHTFNQIFQA